MRLTDYTALALVEQAKQQTAAQELIGLARGIGSFANDSVEVGARNSMVLLTLKLATACWWAAASILVIAAR